MRRRGQRTERGLRLRKMVSSNCPQLTEGGAKPWRFAPGEHICRRRSMSRQEIGRHKTLPTPRMERQGAQ
jgi:hypothetical protein